MISARVSTDIPAQLGHDSSRAVISARSRRRIACTQAQHVCLPHSPTGGLSLNPQLAVQNVHTQEAHPGVCAQPSTRAPQVYATREQFEGTHRRSEVPRRVLMSGLLALAPVLQACALPNASHAALVDEDAAIRVYSTSLSSVVSVALYKRGPDGADISLGVGTGFVWDNLGHIVTNYHVISKLDKSSDVTKIIIPGDTGGAKLTALARVVAMDTMTDLAVLQVSDEDAIMSLTPALIGTSQDLRIGQSVFAVGAPYGLSSTLSAGVVSGLNRSIPSPVGTRIYGVIQTDASINAGNSGGPLLDSSGRVVGVNTATFTRQGTGRGSGVNFALPIDKVRDVVPNLIVYGNPAGKRI